MAGCQRERSNSVSLSDYIHLPAGGHLTAAARTGPGRRDCRPWRGIGPTPDSGGANAEQTDAAHIYLEQAPLQGCPWAGIALQLSQQGGGRRRGFRHQKGLLLAYWAR